MLAGRAGMSCMLSGYRCQEYGSWPQPTCDKQDIHPDTVFLEGDAIEK